MQRERESECVRERERERESERTDGEKKLARNRGNLV